MSKYHKLLYKYIIIIKKIKKVGMKEGETERIILYNLKKYRKRDLSFFKKE